MSNYKRVYVREHTHRHTGGKHTLSHNHICDNEGRRGFVFQCFLRHTGNAGGESCPEAGEVERLENTPSEALSSLFE